MFRARWIAGFRLGQALLSWLLLAVALGLVGWSKSINLLLIFAFVMVCLLPFHAWLARRMVRRIGGERGPLPLAFAGNSFAYTLPVSNAGEHPATIQIEETGGQRWFLAQLAPFETIRCSSSIAFPARGRHSLPEVFVESGFPFGIVAFHRQLLPPAEVLVLPAMGVIRAKAFHHWLRHQGHGDHRRYRPTLRPALSEGDVRRFRPYRPGDNPRDVHWKTSARRGQILVREYDRSPPSELVIFVEPYSPKIGEAHSLLEWALSLVMTIAATWTNGESAGPVRLILLGSPPSLTNAAGFPESFRILAEVEGQSEFTPWLPDRHDARLRRSVRVFVSSRANSPYLDRFAALRLPVLAIDPDQPPSWYTAP